MEKPPPTLISPNRKFFLSQKSFAVFLCGKVNIQIRCVKTNLLKHKG